MLPQSSVGGCRVTRSCAEFEPDFGRRSSFGDAGWAGHTVPEFRDTFVCTPTSLLMAFADTGRPADISIQIRRSNT